MGQLYDTELTSFFENLQVWCTFWIFKLVSMGGRESASSAQL